MDTDDSVRLTYTGEPALVGWLAQLIADEGLPRPSYTPPVEYKDGLARAVEVALVVQASTAVAKVSVRVAVAKFKRRFPNARIDGVPPDSAE